MKATIIKKSLNALDRLGRFFADHTLPIRGVPVEKDIPYDDGSEPERRLDVYRPAGPGPHPVVVYFHGGAWLVSDKASYARVSKILAQAGYLVFNANYRLLPEHKHPAQVQDAALAIRWVYENAKRFGGDRHGITLMGDSAGAHLASWYTTALGRPALFDRVGAVAPIPRAALRGQVLFYGVYNLFALQGSDIWGVDLLLRLFLDKGSPAYAEKAAEASPAHHVGPSNVPTLVVAGEKDRLFPQSLEFAEALRRQGAPVETLFLAADEYPDGGHAFLNFHTRRSFRDALVRTTAFLERVSGLAPAPGRVIPFHRPGYPAVASAVPLQPVAELG